jgi:hypothetical protein
MMDLLLCGSKEKVKRFAQIKANSTAFADLLLYPPLD